MPIKKIIHGIKKLNDNEKLSASLDMRKHIDEISKIGWKRFWKANNKIFYLLLSLILCAVGIVYLLNTDTVIAIRTDMFWSKVYLLGTIIIYTVIMFYIMHYYLQIGIKQDFNTDNFMRTKMNKLKGIDWKSAEEPYLKKK